jgi:hypothetical protein
METHANHLHHAPGKKIWHYFYEFLMLFLAVFCGFLAENFREHKVEKERSEQYIFSLYEDLKADTAELSKDINYDEQKLLALNTMYTCYDTIQKNNKATSCLWNLVAKSQANRRFLITDRTLNQLANAGGYRLLRMEDADSIISYESRFKSFNDFQATIFQQAQDNVRNTFNMLADFNSNWQTLRNVNGSDNVVINSNRPFLLSNDKILLNKYFNELLLYMRVTNRHLQQMVELRNRATGLIAFYKTNHSLD